MSPQTQFTIGYRHLDDGKLHTITITAETLTEAYSKVYAQFGMQATGRALEVLKGKETKGVSKNGARRDTVARGIQQDAYTHIHP